MTNLMNGLRVPLNRRSFVKQSLMAAGAATVGSSLLTSSAFADTASHSASKTLTRNGSLSSGDAALLRFAAAAELLEADFWIQYNELGGIQDSEVPGGTGNTLYTDALNTLDEDMSQYVHDNTDDEITHNQFLNAYLAAHGAAPVNLDPFRTL